MSWNRDQRDRAVLFLAARDGGLVCVYCGHSLTRPEPRFEFSHWYPTIDHVHPKSQGGTNVLSNLVLACRVCNMAKGSEAISAVVSTLRAFQTRLRKMTVKMRDMTEHIGRLKQERDAAQWAVRHPSDAAYDAAIATVARHAEGVPDWVVTLAVNAAASAQADGFVREVPMLVD